MILFENFKWLTDDDMDLIASKIYCPINHIQGYRNMIRFMGKYITNNDCHSLICLLSDEKEFNISYENIVREINGTEFFRFCCDHCIKFITYLEHQNIYFLQNVKTSIFYKILNTKIPTT